MTKKKSGGGGGGGGATTISEEKVLTAVVIADTFTRHFHPLSLECPVALLPLANTPLIDHALSMLCLAKVSKTFVYTSRGAGEIEEHIANLRRGDDRLGVSGMEIVVRSYPPSARNAVDALRDVYDRGDIESDFVLVTGPVVASFDLSPIIEQHRARREQYPDTLMTCVLRRCAPSNLSRSESDDVAVVLDPVTRRMFHYASMNRRGALRLDGELLEKCAAVSSGPVEVRCDILDTCIDVCSPNVLFQAVDNFDFQSIRGGLVAKLLANDEVVEHRFYAEILSETDFAASVHDLKTYAAVTSNVCKRWGSLVAPDANVHGGRSSYRYKASSRSFIDQGVDIARTSMVRSASQIASGSTVAERAVVEGSTLGHGVRIGPGATVRGSFLWAGVVVGEGAVVESSIVASGAVIGPGARVGPGAVISFGVHVEAGTTIGAGKRITLLTAEEATDVDCRDVEAVIVAGEHVPKPWNVPAHLTCPSLPGSRRPSRGTAKSSRVSDDLNGARMSTEDSAQGASGGFSGGVVEAASDALSRSSAPQRQWREYGPLDDCDVPSSSDEEDPFEGTGPVDDIAAAEIASIRADSLTAQRTWCACGADHMVPDPVTMDDSDASDEFALATAEDHFVKEVRETIARGVEEGLLLTNVAMEIKSLRLSCDRSNAETARCALEGLLELLDFGADNLKAEFDRWKAMLAQWKALVTAIMPPDVMMDLLLVVVDLCDDYGAAGLKLFPAILLELYEHDILSEEVCFAWERDAKADADQDSKKFLQAAQGFLTWLREAEEDDSDEESESGEDE